MIIKNLVEKLKENMNNIYYLRFLHLIFKYVMPNVVFDVDFNVSICVLHKKQFSAMINNDRKKGALFGPLVYPEQFTDLLNQRLANLV